MNNKIQILTSGISLVDKGWGGLYIGGTYLLSGQQKSGCTTLALQYARECVEQGNVCLFYTTMRPKELTILAAAIDFDFEYYMNQNLIILVKVMPPMDNDVISDKDEFLATYLKDTLAFIDQYQPDKIIFDDFTDFTNFREINLLKTTFSSLVETIENNNVTSLFVLKETAEIEKESVVDTLFNISTGIIQLNNSLDDITGRIAIKPNIGHPEGKFTANYKLDPYIGIIDDYNSEHPIVIDKDLTNMVIRSFEEKNRLN